MKRYFACCLITTIRNLFARNRQYFRAQFIQRRAITSSSAIGLQYSRNGIQRSGKFFQLRSQFSVLRGCGSDATSIIGIQFTEKVGSQMPLFPWFFQVLLVHIFRLYFLIVDKLLDM